MCIKRQLNQFCGTTEYNLHWLSPTMYLFLTDGTQFLKEKTRCEWLFDHIIQARQMHELRGEEFQVWSFKMAVGSKSGLLWCTDGNNNIIYGSSVQESYADLDGTVIWVVKDVAMLPNEY